MTLPLWRSHKRVAASKILSILPTQPGATLVCQDDTVEVLRTYLAKHQPEAGGYYVRYEDGYESWSPAAAFETGYTLIEEPLDAA